MAPMKAMKAGGKAMTKGAIAETLATQCELKKSVAAKAMKVTWSPELDDVSIFREDVRDWCEGQDSSGRSSV